MTVRDMQYADDAAIAAGCAMEMQVELGVTDAQFSSVGLMMNTDKTQLVDNTVVEQLISIRSKNLNGTHIKLTLEVSSWTKLIHLG